MENNKVYLLKEYTTFEYDEPASEIDSVGSSNKPLILKGILQRCNTLNQNGRIYPREVLLREIGNYMKLVRDKRAFGELDHADSPIVNMKNISHMITDITLDGDVIKGTVHVLDTPGGNIIKAIIKAGGKPGISSRALGSLVETERGNIVQNDLQIICWDFVSEPSTPGAFMMTEAKQVDPKLLNKMFNKSDRVDRAVNELLSVLDK
jgi:hypothetical protein